PVEPEVPNEPDEPFESVEPVASPHPAPETGDIPVPLSLSNAREDSPVPDAGSLPDTVDLSSVKMEDLFEPEVVPVHETRPAAPPSPADGMNKVISDLLTLSQSDSTPHDHEPPPSPHPPDRAPDRRSEVVVGTRRHLKIFEVPAGLARTPSRPIVKIERMIKPHRHPLEKPVAPVPPTLPDEQVTPQSPAEEPAIQTPVPLQIPSDRGVETPAGPGDVELLPAPAPEDMPIASPHPPDTAPQIPLSYTVIPMTMQKPALSEEQFNARWIIEALRLGIVPHQQVEQFSCGREVEMEKMDEWLSSGDGCMMLSGAYGAGKSHMLNLTLTRALRQGWAVALVEIDPEETPFNQPKKIYRQIIRSFRYTNGERDCIFADFVADICSAQDPGASGTIREHPIIGKLISARSQEISRSVDDQEYTDEDLQNWIEGEEITIPGLPRLDNFQTMGNLYCNILSGIGWGVTHMLGLRGLLILMDEGESIDKSWDSGIQSANAENFLKGLILMANNDTNLKLEAEALHHHRYGGMFDAQNTGSLTKLRYGGRKKHLLPFIWGETSHVKMLFSFVPEIVEVVNTTIIHDDEIWQQIRKIELSPLDEGDFMELSENIRAMYARAYHYSAPESIEPVLKRDKTRRFVKSVVESLDVMRFNPGTWREELHLPIETGETGVPGDTQSED
ncbi:MAG: BREX system ATP-binding domain-containing protein, partial [Methanoregula sp.]